MRIPVNIPERRLSAPGRMPSDMDGDTPRYVRCRVCNEKLPKSDRESPACRDCGCFDEEARP